MRPFSRPVTPFRINQEFGENNVCISVNTGKVIQCDGNNPPSGYVSVYGPKGHLGIDLHANHGKEVYCALDGVVDSIDTDIRSGLDVRIISIHKGKKYRHIYEHLLGYQCKVGDRIKTGQLIGWADNTGLSSNDHLHFQVEIWDGKWVPINPLSVMNDVPALKVLRIENLLKYIFEQLARLMDNSADFLRRK